MKNAKKIILFFIIVSIVLCFSVPIFAKKILKFIYPIKYSYYVYKYSNYYNLDPYLVFSIIKTESNFNADAVSNRNARGLMQISSITGQWAEKTLKIKNYSDSSLYSPEMNIRIGCWYVSRLNKEFNNDKVKVLAAYNGGSGNVNNWIKNKQYSNDGVSLNKIPFQETDNFVKKVDTAYNTYVYLYDND